MPNVIRKPVAERRQLYDRRVDQVCEGSDDTGPTVGSS